MSVLGRAAAVLSALLRLVELEQRVARIDARLHREHRLLDEQIERLDDLETVAVPLSASAPAWGRIERRRRERRRQERER